MPISAWPMLRAIEQVTNTLLCQDLAMPIFEFARPTVLEVALSLDTMKHCFAYTDMFINLIDRRELMDLLRWGCDQQMRWRILLPYGSDQQMRWRVRPPHQHLSISSPVFSTEWDFTNAHVKPGMEEWIPKDAVRNIIRSVPLELMSDQLHRLVEPSSVEWQCQPSPTIARFDFDEAIDSILLRMQCTVIYSTSGWICDCGCPPFPQCEHITSAMNLSTPKNRPVISCCQMKEKAFFAKHQLRVKHNLAHGQSHCTCCRHRNRRLSFLADYASEEEDRRRRKRHK